MSETNEVGALVIDLTPAELDEIRRHGQLIIPFNGSFIAQDPVFSIEVEEYK